MNETTKQTRPQNRYDVSCLVTFHSEGYLAHRTLTSIGMCRDYAEKRGLHVELVLVLDNADAVTEAVVAGHFAVRKDDQILRVHERSAPMSRNKGIQAAKGEFISIHDGDDYYSENLVYEGVAQCKAQPRLITHAEINIGFESEYYMYRVGNIRHGDYTKYDLLTQNPLSVQTIAPRHVFIQIPYQPTGNGFGYEDWHWNAETIAAGFEHVTVPHTFMFYRRKRQGSVLARESASKSLIRPSRLFDQLESPMHELSSSILRDNLSENTSRKPVVSADLADVVKTARRKSRLYAFLKPPAKKLISKLPDDLQPPAKAFAWSFLALARSVREHVRNKRPTPAVQTSPAVPQTEKPAPEIFPTVSMAECVAALKRISRLDSSLHPDVNPPLYEYRFVSDDRLGRLFALLYNPIKGQRYDAVYLVPWLVPGGADLMTINFANTLAGQGKKVLVISTLPCPSPWRNQLAEGVDFVDLGNAADGFFNEDKKLLLARILLQLQPKAVHCMLSQLGYETFIDYAAALRQYMKLYAAFYCDEKRKDGSDAGYVPLFLMAILPIVSGISTDNTVMPRLWHRKYGAPLALFSTVYGRMDFAPSDGENPFCSGKSVLWAGRFCQQKRPELLLEIVKKMPETHFFVYGEPYAEEDRHLYSSFKSLPNVTLGGKYSGFVSLPVKECFCFLYTSAYDGLPNVLLEAAAAGLPTIAPDIGGISDFINDQTGWLVGQDASADDYARAMEEMRSAPELRRTKVLAAQNLLHVRHNETAFKNSILKFYGF
ncbi:glycosyltransferase [Pyramidobacter sp. C12-8]|uniref:glycosyltransferase n=1 Tax=Pyramidobacter sp. C12-8 TaxID=1943580 RepID=UPI00098ECC2D|nr:glycosyltransferase [Pyramidobacter sp. C12-8]OON89450.1 hypothetical protein B0D78_03625 [Pyramidobacter sp. C12-8]